LKLGTPHIQNDKENLRNEHLMSACKPFAANQNKENDVSEDRPLSVCTAPFEELNTENTPQKAEK